MKKLLAIGIILLFFATFAFGAEFWASKNSNKYHYPSCQYAQKISPKNLIKFESPEQAIKAGYVPCKVCKPPTASRTELEEDGHMHIATLH
jgi:methylphosphotriester-DNA--protein-cysteine methyltransferase